MEVPRDGLKIRFKEEDGAVFFESYIPPSRDAVHLPTYVLYLLMAMFIMGGVLYAIIGHLMKDLIHDFAGEWLETSWDLLGLQGTKELLSGTSEHYILFVV